MNYGKSHNYGTRRRPMWKRILSSPLSLIVIVVLSIVIFRAVWGISEKADLSRTKLDQAQSELTKLQDRETDLESQVGRLSTDQGIESEIRTKFKGVRTGESVAVIISNDDTASVTSASSTASVGWFRGLLHWIGL